MHLHVCGLKVVLAEDDGCEGRGGVHGMYHAQCMEGLETIDKRFNYLVVDLSVDGGSRCEAEEGLVVHEVVFLFHVALWFGSPLIDGIQWCPSCPG